MTYQKLSALIVKLEKARDEYIARYDIEPTIWDWDEYEGLQLCAGTRKMAPGKKAPRPPCMNFKRIKPEGR